MNTWKVILATMVIFGAGVVTGLVGGGLLVHYVGGSFPQVRRFAQVRPPPSPSAGGMRLDFLRRVQSELDLTPDQRERISQIFRDSQERTKKIMEPVSPQIREELKRTRAEFVEVLTPEQRKRFNDLLKQQQQRSREQRQGQPQTNRGPAFDSLVAPQTNP